MNDEAALLTAIIAHPNEDTPRLMYADWLQEHGQQQRAAAIRAHIELQGIEGPHTPNVVGLRNHYDPTSDEADRWNYLLTVVAAVTSNPELNGLSATLASFGSEDLIEWSRGFVESVTCDAPDWIEHGDAIRQEQPVTCVRLTWTPTFRSDENDAWLEDDPSERHFSWAEIDAVELKDESLDSADATVLRLLMLRWPGVSFKFGEE